jgi:hypothetical protein
MMMGIGFAEIIVLALLSGGLSDTDLITLVQPTHYFKSRQIEISVDRAIELANKDPKDAKTQIMQLSALRYLADESATLKKSTTYADYRKVIEQIAQGKKAQDPEGFARDYANRVLLKLDNAKPEAAKFRPVREDALNWFPANVTIAGALDFRQVRMPGGGGLDPVRDLVKMIPERERNEMYNLFEKSGNIRGERVAFAYTNGTGKGNGDAKIYMRFTGKGNHDWILEMFRSIDGGRMQINQIKDEKGPPIAILQSPNDAPSFVLVGNTDLLVVGYERRVKQNDLVDEVLDARSKKKPNATSGALKARLAKVPDRAIAFLVGDTPDELLQALAFTFNPVPTNITAWIERTDAGMDVQAHTSMSGVDNADKLVRKVADLRKQGIDELKKAQQQPRRPGERPIPFQSFTNLLESLQVQSNGEAVQVRMVVPDSLVREMMNTFRAIAPLDEPPPPKKCSE